MGAEASHTSLTRPEVHDLANTMAREESQKMRRPDQDKIIFQSQLEVPSKSQLIRMHFSDYSLFPDRFQDPSTLLDSRRESPDQILPASVPSNPISKYTFRIRSPSSTEFPGASSLPVSCDGHDPNRPRSASQGNTKLYYFDYSLIPDKDPNFAIDQNSSHVDPGNRRRLYSTGDIVGNKEERHQIQTTHPIVRVNDQTIKEEDEYDKVKTAPTRQRKMSEPTRFCFFDYSMIPDKDPRWRSDNRPNTVAKND